MEETEVRLENTTVIMPIACGYHEHEFWFPYYRFKEEGSDVIVAGIEKGAVMGEGRNGKDGLLAEITHTVEEASELDFDCLYLPGGIYGPLALRAHAPLLELVRKAMDTGVIVGAICHAFWILVSADVLPDIGSIESTPKTGDPATRKRFPDSGLGHRRARG